MSLLKHFAQPMIDKQVKKIEEVYQKQLASLNGEYNALKETLKMSEEELAYKVKIIDKLNHLMGEKQKELDLKKYELDKMEVELKELQDVVCIKDSGVYEDLQQAPLKFSNSESYVLAIKKNTNLQEQMVERGEACFCKTNWTINNSVKKGNKMSKDSIALSLRCFNSECGVIINNIKATQSIDSIHKKIIKSFQTINRLNSVSAVVLSEKYLDLKIEMATLVYERLVRIAEEKAEAKYQREILREEEKLAREVKKEKEKLMKERVKYEQELQRLLEQEKYEERVEELQNKIQELNNKEINLEERLKNKAGYVYVISNPLLPNHFKLGVTRRLDPMERIRELSSASLAFKLDVHAIIFSEDAFALETKLHQQFDSKRINKFNKKKEWFDLTIEEIKLYIHQEVDSTVEFLKVYNEEYEMSKKLN